VALEARAELAEELRQIAQRVVELPAVDEYYAARSRAALHHLERRLFEGPSERLDPGPAVRLLEASGERAEAELLGAEVLALLGAEVPAEEIAVVYRSLPDRPVIEHVFRSYGIPIAIDRRVPFGHTTLGRSVLALARCALLGEEEAQAQELVAYLRSPGLLDRPEVVDALETRIRCEGLRTAAQARERARFSLDEIDALRQAADPMAELERSARRLLALPSRAKAALLAGDQQLDARVLATLSRALADCRELGEAPAGPELIELVAGLRVPAGSPARDGAVLVSEPLPIRARRFRAVFLCGLQEQEFPRLPAPEPFLSDERRWELAASSGLRLRPQEDALARERYLFYACASRATEQVAFSYRSSDEEGNLALPSPFLAEVSDLFVEGWRERRRRRLLADVAWPPEEAPTERELARSLAAAGAPSAGDDEPPARFLGPAALAHVRHMEIVSAGALEAYADCPMKWLVERELQPARIDPDPDPLARGAYMHRVLEDVLRRLGAAVTPASLPDALRILDEVIADHPDGIAAGRPPGVRVAVAAAIKADLRRYLRHEAAGGCGWEPRGLELRFGFSDEEESLPPLALGEGPERTLLRGVIDRVDVDPSGRRAVVRDYKSGARRPEHPVARWRADRQLQVALYMIAVRELLELEPVAGLYQPLGGDDLRARGMYLKEAPVGNMLVAGDGRDDEELRAELEHASERALELATRLRAGELTPCPETCSPNGCRHPGICRSA
jgi:ATP-dependent helicase/DNAse subunit B